MTRTFRNFARSRVARARVLIASFAWLAASVLLYAGASTGLALSVLMGGVVAHAAIMPGRGRHSFRRMCPFLSAGATAPPIRGRRAT